VDAPDWQVTGAVAVASHYVSVSFGTGTWH
jgi:hypothetical protein